MEPFNDYEIRCIKRDDLVDAVMCFQSRTACPRIEAQRAVYAKFREINDLPEPTEMYVGFHDDHEIPIKRGDKVTIVKGTLIKNIQYGDSIAKRTYKVKIDHILPGTTRFRNHRGEVSSTITNPSIRWPGKNGYWSEVDINLIPEACSNCSGIDCDSCMASNCPGKAAKAAAKANAE